MRGNSWCIWKNSFCTGTGSRDSSLFRGAALWCACVTFVWMTTPFRGRCPRLGQPSPDLTILRLHKNKLSGEVPPSYQSLTQLTNFSIYMNNFSGTIPSFFSSMTNMMSLQMHGNHFNGTIPTEWCSLMFLTMLYISSNHLDGTLPSCFGTSFPFLNVLMADDNRLTGTIPETFGNLKALNILSLGANALTGTLPSSLGALRQLWILNVSSNRLTGPIPTSLSGLGYSLLYLNVSHNAHNGTLPDALRLLFTLLVLDVSSNFISGTLPEVWPTGMWSLCTDNSSDCSNVLTSLSGTFRNRGFLLSFDSIVGLQVRDNCLINVSIRMQSLPHGTWWRNRSVNGTLLNPQRSPTACDMLPPSAGAPQRAPSHSSAVPPVVFSLMVVATATASALGAPLSGTVPLLMQRVSSALTTATDALYTTDPLSLPDSPLQLRVVPSWTRIDGGAHRGAVVGNAALCLAAGIAWIAAAVVVACILRKRRKRRGTSYRTLLRDVSLNDAAFPGLWLSALCLPLLQPTLLSSMVLLSGGFPDDVALTTSAGWRGIDIGLGCCGLFLSLLLLCGVGLRLDPRGGRLRHASASPSSRWFLAVYKPSMGKRATAPDSAVGVSTVHAPPRRGQPSSETVMKGADASLLLLQWAKIILGGGGIDPVVWRNVTACGDRKSKRRAAGASFVARYGDLFESCRYRRHWWSTAELVLSALLVIVAIVASRRSEEEGAVSTAAGSWASAVILFLWTIGHAITSPYRSRCDRIVAVALSGLATVAAILTAVAGGNDESVSAAVADTINLIAAIVSLLGTVLPMMARVVTLRAMFQQRAVDDDDIASSQNRERLTLRLLRWLARFHADKSNAHHRVVEHCGTLQPPIATATTTLPEYQRPCEVLQSLLVLICRSRRFPSDDDMEAASHHHHC